MAMVYVADDLKHEHSVLCGIGQPYVASALRFLSVETR